MPDSVASFGITGVARVAGLTLLIEGAYAAAAAAMQYAEGNYVDILGAQDGKKYHAKVGSGTGIYTQPTLIPGLGLVAENDREIVFNPSDTNKILNTPGLINAINATIGVRQFASGNAREIIKESNNTQTTFTDPLLLAVLERLMIKLDEPTISILQADEDYINSHKKAISDHANFMDSVNG